MYEININVDELKVRLLYLNYEKALFEFKDCVHEILNLSKDEDDIIMKLSNEYGICLLQNDEYEYKIELKYAEKEEGDEC